MTAVMSDIEKTNANLSSIALRRENHVPEVGDIYMGTGRDPSVMKITKISLSKNGYKDYEYDEWDFINEQWITPESFYGHLDDKEYYRWIPEGAEKILELEKRAYAGESILPKGDSKVSESTDLVTQGRDRLEQLLKSSEALQDTVESVNLVMRARICQEEEILASKRRDMEAQLKTVNRQLSNIKKTIGLLEMYSGKSLEITQVCSGTPAPAGTPLAIRQRILFMDEELAVVEDGYGLDYRNLDQFREWLKKPVNRDIIVPEQRCVVCMKPRRYSRTYPGTAYENAVRNSWNRHTFIVMRNGENVYMIESEDICIYDAAIPRKKDIDAIAKQMSSDWHHSREQALEQQEDINWRASYFAMIIQGLADHTDIFSPRTPGLSVVKNVGVEFVFDDEEDTLLGTGLPPFREFMRESSKKIRRGSRIVYLKGGEPKRFEFYVHGQGFGYEPRYKINAPASGIYSVDQEGEDVSFTFLPKGDVYTRYEVKERTRRERWVIDPSTVLNFDALDIDILEAYLKDRTQRESYEEFIPLLSVIRPALKKEREYERLFASQLERVLDDEKIPHTPELIGQAIKWWKEKVIYIRPISKDDDKAWRMIKQYIRRAQMQEG